MLTSLIHICRFHEAVFKKIQRSQNLDPIFRFSGQVNVKNLNCRVKQRNCEIKINRNKNHFQKKIKINSGFLLLEQCTQRTAVSTVLSRKTVQIGRSGVFCRLYREDGDEATLCL